MSAFRIAYELEIWPPSAGGHECLLISQQGCAERDGISPTRCDVVWLRPTPARIENCRYRSTGSVRYCRRCDWSAEIPEAGRATRHIGPLFSNMASEDEAPHKPAADRPRHPAAWRSEATDQHDSSSEAKARPRCDRTTRAEEQDRLACDR